MKAHRFDWVSFLLGGVFVIAGVLLVTETRLGIRMEWAVPSAVVLLGLALLFAAIPRRSRRDPDAPADEAERAAGR